MSKVWVRMIIVAVFYVVILGMAGSTLIGHYIYDITATYYSMGMFGLPIALLIIFFFDRWLSKKKWFANKPIRLTALHLVICFPLYYLLTIVVLAGLARLYAN